MEKKNLTLSQRMYIRQAYNGLALYSRSVFEIKMRFEELEKEGYISPYMIAIVMAGKFCDGIFYQPSDTEIVEQVPRALKAYSEYRKMRGSKLNFRLMVDTHIQSEPPIEKAVFILE